MSSKPRSQIGTISHAPPRTRNAASVAPVGNHQEAARQCTSGIARPTSTKIQSSQGDTEKRRSLLPQPGQHRYNARRSSTLPEVCDQDSGSGNVGRDLNKTQHQPDIALPAQDVQVPRAVPGRLPPRSTYQTDTPSSQRTDHIEKMSAPQTMQPPVSVGKPVDSQVGGLGRSQSLRKPNVTSQSAQSPGPPGHVRTQSTSLISAPRRNVARSNTISERPKSLVMAPTRALRNTNTLGDTLPGATRTWTRNAEPIRPASTKARSEVLSGPPSTGTVPRTEEPVATQSRRKHFVLEEPKTASRPAFSTLQQHFTPRKGGKAPTATFINPAPQTVSQSLPPETASLQSELLQLHLLHHSSAETHRYWAISAKREMRTQFEEVASLYQVMLQNQCAAREQKNLQSLLELSAGGLIAGLVEHVQALSEPLHELPSLIGYGGRMQHLVNQFERWLSCVQDVQFARQDSGGAEAALGTIEGLGDSWKVENAALTRKLTAFARGLNRLASPTPGSSIAYIAEACKAILYGILDELQKMQRIEIEVVSRERKWVEYCLQLVARDVGIPWVDADGQSAAWRIQ